ncbi:uncharacterized protein TNCV_994691 [Trichonephila clavipes]|nr:uncharacterized protein TNCV_994691 [Trichonephila clavipes]
MAGSALAVLPPGKNGKCRNALQKETCIAQNARLPSTEAFPADRRLYEGMVIGLRREGWSFRQIAADTNRDESTVHRLWRRWLARSRGPDQHLLNERGL